MFSPAFRGPIKDVYNSIYPQQLMAPLTFMALKKGHVSMGSRLREIKGGAGGVEDDQWKDQVYMERGRGPDHVSGWGCWGALVGEWDATVAPNLIVEHTAAIVDVGSITCSEVALTPI